MGSLGQFAHASIAQLLLFFLSDTKSLTCDDFSTFLPVPFGCRVLSNRARRKMLCCISLPLGAVKALPAPYNATLRQVRILWDTGASGRKAWAGPQNWQCPGTAGKEFFPSTFLYFLRYNLILGNHLLLHESFLWVEKKPHFFF